MYLQLGGSYGTSCEFIYEIEANAIYVVDKRDEEHKTYCYQCYKQKSRGIVKARLAKGLDISDTCDVPMVAEWKLEAIAYTLFNQIFYDKESLIEIANELLENEICENNNDSELDEYVSCLEKKIIAIKIN